MKKVLNVLCMALLAGGMIFTSCTKNFTITVNTNNDAWGTVTGAGTYADGAEATLTATPAAGYEFEKWQDGNTTNPRVITVTADETYTAYFREASGTKVTFNGTSWTAASAAGVDHTADNYITFYFYKVANSDENPYAQGFLESYPVSGATYESTSGGIMQYRDPNYIFTDVDNILGQGAGAMFWGWNSLSSTFVENITAVDLNALTISGDWSVEVGSVETYATTGGDWGTTYPFTGKMTNANWAWTSKCDVKKVKNNAPTVR